MEFPGGPGHKDCCHSGGRCANLRGRMHPGRRSRNPRRRECGFGRIGKGILTSPSSSANAPAPEKNRLGSSRGKGKRTNARIRRYPKHFADRLGACAKSRGQEDPPHQPGHRRPFGRYRRERAVLFRFREQGNHGGGGHAGFQERCRPVFAASPAGRSLFQGENWTCPVCQAPRSRKSYPAGSFSWRASKWNRKMGKMLVILGSRLISPSAPMKPGPMPFLSICWGVKNLNDCHHF